MDPYYGIDLHCNWKLYIHLEGAQMHPKKGI